MLKYEFSNFWWGFDVAHRLAWPTGLPTTLVNIEKAMFLWSDPVSFIIVQLS